MPELTSLQDLALSLRGASGRIGIDGRDGTRKSTIASFLAEQLNMTCIHIDEFLIKEQGGYVAFIDYDRLTDALRLSPTVVVEGVCLLHVLDKVGIRVDTHVYVKRYHLGLWADERDLDIPLAEVEDFLEKERHFASVLSNEPEDDGPSMHDDIVRYHASYRPHETAHLVYRWDDV